MNKIKTIDIDNIFEKFMIIYPFLLIIDTKIVLNFFNIFLLVLTIIKVKKDGFKKSFLEKWIILFLIGIIISFINAPYRISDGVNQIGRILRWIFFPLILGQFNISQKIKRYILYSAGTAIIIYGIKFGLSIMGVNSSRYGSRYSGGAVISQISLILGVYLIVTLILLMYEKLTIKERILLLAVNIISLILLILTQTRGMYLSVIFVIPLILFIKNIKHFILVSIFGILIGSILLITMPNNKYIVRLKSVVRLDGSNSESNSGRIEVWKESYRIFKENPLNGVGYDNFMKAQREGIYKYNKIYAHSHNTILKFLSETGIIGFLGYILLVGSIILKGIKGAKRDLNYLIITGIFLCLFFYENVDMIIWRHFAYPFIYFILGVLLNKEYKNCKDHLLEKVK